MVFDNRRTYLCYDNSDLIRDGYIRTTIEKEYRPVDTFNINRLNNPPKGVSYIPTRDDDTNELIAIKEVKKQLPASKIKIEVDFSKVMKNVVEHPIYPGSMGFTPMMGLAGTLGLPAWGFGGISTGLTYMTIHILDAETKINKRIVVTQEMLDTGIWECDDGYPLSVFGIVTDHFVDPVAGKKSGHFTRGLEFNVNDPLKNPDVIGKYSDGVWQGTRRKNIDGATDDDGLFGGAGDAEIKFENVAYPEQPQLFDKIVKDKRKLKFRGDNYDASGGKDYPFKLTGKAKMDATDKQIRLKLTDDRGKPLFKLGDTLYITYSVAFDRHVRQNLSHRGDIGQGNTLGIVGFRGAIKSEVDAWDYQLKTWKVPLLPDEVAMKNIDEIGDYYNVDDDYKLTPFDYMGVRELEEDGQDISEACEDIEGWRLSEAITNGHVKKFWTADYRGILLYDESGGTDFEEIIQGLGLYVSPEPGQKNITVIFPASEIRDQEWFRDYLESLDFTCPSGGVDSDENDVYLTSDFEKKIEDNIDLDREPGLLFDLSEISNSLLFDREKIPYHRPLSNALRNMQPYQEDDDESGVGIILLDLLKVVNNQESGVNLSSADLMLYDLSNIELSNSNTQRLKSYSCEELFDIHAYDYWSESYDTSTATGGIGAWYDKGYIMDQVVEWRPAGGTIESYWKLETPYFCGSYTRKSRIYTEKLFGPSLDNYSWIFVDTEPFVPHNISLDNHHSFDESIVVFSEENMHDCLCYHKFVESLFEMEETSVVTDISRSHVRGDYNHDADFMVGQNRMLGDYPSYSHGIPITDEIARICPTEYAEGFWFTEELYDNTHYSLDFGDDIPTVFMPENLYVKNLKIDFYAMDFDDLTEIEKYVSFYFENSASSISQVRMLRHDSNSGIMRMLVDFKYYHNGPLQFLGEFWKKITVTKVELRGTSPDHALNTTAIDLDDYKIKSGQNAVAYDGMGRLLVFYANTTTSNIDVAVSYDDGGEWIFHKNLIRLINGESATLPFAVKDRDPDYIHLFYVLNDTFLMYKRINSDFFVDVDASVTYKVPDSYEVDDYDQTKEKPEEEYWGYYTEKGLMLRRTPSYFIAGHYEDPYFVKQLVIKDGLTEDYLSSPETDVRQTLRFDFSGNYNEMKRPFPGTPYAVYMDDEGVFRLFFISYGKLCVKRSNNYFTWKYDIDEQIVHKTYLDEQLNKGLPEEISNIQVVRNSYTSGWTSVLYFNNGMLFIRHFQSDLLFPSYDSDGNMNNDNMREHLEITPETTHRPIFLVGKIPDNIKAIKLKEIDDKIKESDSSLFLSFPYDKDMIEKFDEKFEVDTDTQVYAYTTRTGLIRIFYKDSLGNLNSITLDALRHPVLGTMNKFEER